MSRAGFSRKISGADKFQLLLDRHIRLKHSTGNISRLSIQVNGRIDVDELRKTVKENIFLTRINSLEIDDGLFRIPLWKNGGNQNEVQITEHFNEEVSSNINTDIKVNSGRLLHIDLFRGETTSTMVISVQHVLADHHGIEAIAKIIAGLLKPPDTIFTNGEKGKITFTGQLSQTLKAILFVFSKRPKRLASLTSPESKQTPDSAKLMAVKATSILRFTKEETEQVENNALKNGARLLRSSFYLATVAKALSETVFKNKGDAFFLPVPQNQRLKGSSQISIGNQLSFLFYNIPFDKLINLPEATAFITKQTMEQAKEQMPKSYSYLLQIFRFLPLSVYDFFFKLPTKGAVCSFLFSDVGETLPDLKKYLGKPVIEMLSFPSNPSPPGITLAFMKYDESLKVITSYDRNCIDATEIAKFETTLSALLKP